MLMLLWKKAVRKRRYMSQNQFIQLVLNLVWLSSTEFVLMKAFPCEHMQREYFTCSTEHRTECISSSLTFAVCIHSRLSLKLQLGWIVFVCVDKHLVNLLHMGGYSTSKTVMLFWIKAVVGVFIIFHQLNVYVAINTIKDSNFTYLSIRCKKYRVFFWSL